MAITGKLTTIDVGRTLAGQPEVVVMGEATSQTNGLGWPMFINASGYLQAAATNATAFYGFAATAGQNLATDGAKNAAVYKITPGAVFEGTLSHTSWAQSLISSHVGFQTNASSIAWLDTANASVKFVIRGLAQPQRFSVGDSRVRVYFTVLNANIQDEIA